MLYESYYLCLLKQELLFGYKIHSLLQLFRIFNAAIQFCGQYKYTLRIFS